MAQLLTPTFNSLMTTSLTASGAVSGAGFTNLLAPYAPLAGATFTGNVNAYNVYALTPSQGYVGLLPGGGSNTGYVGFYNAAGVRQGYIGYAAPSGAIQLESENGTTGYSVTGNLSVAGFSQAGFLSATGAWNTGTATAQGAYMGWNYTAGGGETDFINNHGSGAGGFSWYNTSSGAAMTWLGNLNSAGAFSANAINNTPIGGGGASSGAFTNLSVTGTVSGAGFSALVAPPIATMAALRANTTTPATLFLQGYHSTADGGEGTFVYVASDTTTADNGGTIIVDASNHRWYREYNREALNICWFGAYVNSATDSLAAFTAALAAGNNILIPAGKFTFSAQIAYNFPNATASLTIAGAGAKVTELVWPTSQSGLVMGAAGALNSFHIWNLAMETGQSGTTYAAITASQSYPLGTENAWEQSDLINVSFRGSDGPELNYYWGTCVQIYGWSGINFINVKIDGQKTGSYTSVGVGVWIVGTSSVIPVVFNFTACIFNYQGIGFRYDSYVQGVSFTQCNFVGGQIGILSPSSASGTVLSELAVNNCQFNCSYYGIQTTTAIGAVLISNSYFFEVVANSVGVYLQATEGFCITGNTFQGPSGTNSSTGINIGANAAAFPGVIVGNCFIRNNTGIVLESNSGYTNVQSNGYTQNATNYVNLVSGGGSNVFGGGSA